MRLYARLRVETQRALTIVTLLYSLIWVEVEHNILSVGVTQRSQEPFLETTEAPVVFYKAGRRGLASPAWGVVGEIVLCPLRGRAERKSAGGARLWPRPPAVSASGVFCCHPHAPLAAV